MKKVRLLISILIGILLLSGCTEEGLGGKASITGFIKHHDEPIPNAMVYLKYAANELPGTDPSLYDTQTLADAEAKYQFEGLQKGNYYLFSEGYDSLIFETVIGGISIELKSGEAFETDVPVTE